MQISDEVWGTEIGLIAQGLYAGTTDCIGVHNGEDAIIDSKTSKKIKKEEWIEDYYPTMLCIRNGTQ